MQNPVSAAFGGIRVVVRYTPLDDPVDRAAYQAWVHDRLDPTNRRWYCNSVFPSISLRDQKRDNAAYSPDIGSGPNSPHPFDDKGNPNERLNPYCPAP